MTDSAARDTPGMVRLAANESPFGLLPSVRTAISTAVGSAGRYPEYHCSALIRALSEWLRVPETHIAVGCGSAGILASLLAATAGPGAEVVHAWRSFEAYPQLIQQSRSVPRPVPSVDGRHDLAAMTAAAGRAARVVLVCNPNNPTGTTVSRAELLACIDRLTDECLLVLDEAYLDFARDEDGIDGVDLCRECDKVAVVRTFSKAHGLAGLRGGYLVAGPAVIEAVRDKLLPFGVNALGQAAAIASIAATDAVKTRSAMIVEERERVRSALSAYGWPAPASHGNFVWLPLADRTEAFAVICRAHGVSVRVFPGEGIRASIGARTDNDAFLSAAESAAFLCGASSEQQKSATSSAEALKAGPHQAV